MRRDIFQAIADPTRRAIIALIALQAMTPNALAENFHITRQAVSKHLRILTECELVTQEWLDHFRKIWEFRFSELDKLLETLKEVKKDE